MAEPTIAFGEFRFEPASGRLTRNGSERPLPPRAAAILRRLLEAPGAVVAREELLRAAWPGTTVTDGSVREAIAQLREALGDEASQPRYIQTLPRRGYRFAAEVPASPARAPWRRWSVGAGLLLGAGAAAAAVASRPHLAPVAP